MKRPMKAIYSCNLFEKLAGIDFLFNLEKMVLSYALFDGMDNGAELGPTLPSRGTNLDSTWLFMFSSFSTDKYWNRETA